jgi:anti-anti-sigma factor
LTSEPITGFSIDAIQEGRVLTLRLSGELDIASAPALEDAAPEPRDWEHLDSVVVDLRSLAFLDSSGLRALFVIDTRAREAGRRARFVHGPRAVRRIFEVTALDERLDMVDEP